MIERIEILHNIENPDNVDLFWSMSKSTAVRFYVSGDRRIHVFITKLEIEDGSGHSWNFEGYVRNVYAPIEWISAAPAASNIQVTGWYHSRSKDKRGPTWGNIQLKK